MPQDRFLHPRLGHSHKVALLTDLEFRVWTQYILSADDFGVMRASAVTLQSANDALAAKKTRAIENSLNAIISADLVTAFNHQERQYICQLDWQDFQKVEYPRSTFEPKPPEEVLAHCTEATLKLFGKHPGGTSKRSSSVPPASSESSPNVSQEIPSHASARPREEAKANAQANGHGSSQGVAAARATHITDDATADRAANLLERYPTLYAQHRRGARVLIKPALDFQRALDICRTWPDDVRIEKMAVILLTTDDTWISGTDRGFGVFASKASWCDDRLREWEAKNGLTV